MKALLVVVSLLLSQRAFAEILDEKRTTQALLELHDTKLTHDTATQLVNIVHVAAEADLDPFILLAQIYIESRFDPTMTSRLVDGTRHTGPWRLRRAPNGWAGNLYCGITQVAARSWAACLALRGSGAAVAAQVAELRAWLQRTRGDLSLALAGYGCGNHGVTTGRCNRYPARVQALAQRLRRRTTSAPTS